MFIKHFHFLANIVFFCLGFRKYLLLFFIVESFIFGRFCDVLYREKPWVSYDLTTIQKNGTRTGDSAFYIMIMINSRKANAIMNICLDLHLAGDVDNCREQETGETILDNPFSVRDEPDILRLTMRPIFTLLILG